MIGIVADDITGASDIGIMYAKANIETHVYVQHRWQPARLEAMKPEVLIFDTNSRLDTSQEAYEKVFRATKSLQAVGCRQFYNKTCSVFRGNIGAEFDAMLDALEASFAVVVLGFPKNGRTTLDGIHYVRGEKLEHSEFRADPVHPMLQSNVVQILQEQTKRVVSHIHYSIVEQGSEALREAVLRKKQECNYVIIDVQDQASLETIAASVYDEPILCGSSALAEELAVLAKPDQAMVSPSVAQEGIGAGPVGTLCAAGSLMPQTSKQVAYLRNAGVNAIELDSKLLLHSASREKHIGEVIVYSVSKLLQGEDVLVYTSNQRDYVEETKLEGSKLGLSNTAVSRTVSDALAYAVCRISEETNQRSLVIAGGETSAAVCEKLGIIGFKIGLEIEPGLPSVISLDPARRVLVLKSGSFGSEDFLYQAIQHVKQRGPCL